jgi:outer membrane protein TolC
MLTQAQQLYELNVEKSKDGLVEAPEVIASEANYQERLNDLRIAQNELTTKNNILKLLLNVTDNATTLVPVESFDLLPEQKTLDDSLKEAFDHRRDYQQAMNDIKAKNIQLSINQNNIWPEINLTASFARNGISRHSFRTAVEKISDEDNPDLFLGVTFNVPIENKEAKAELKKAELEKAKALVAIKLVERTIATEIINQLQTCRVFQEVAANTQRVAELEAQKLGGETKRFQQGRSTTDTIIRFQEDVLESRWASARAMFDYQVSLIELQKKQGTLLRRYWEGEI